MRLGERLGNWLSAAWRRGLGGYLLLAAGLFVLTAGAGLRVANLRTRARNEQWVCRAVSSLAASVERGAKRGRVLARWVRGRAGWAALVRVEGGPLPMLRLAATSGLGLRLGPLDAHSQPRARRPQAKELYDRALEAFVRGRKVWWESAPGRPEQVGCALRHGSWVLAGQARPAYPRVNWYWGVLVAAVAVPGLLLLLVLPALRGRWRTLAVGLAWVALAAGSLAWYGLVAAGAAGAGGGHSAFGELGSGLGAGLSVAACLLVLVAAVGRAFGWAGRARRALAAHRVAYAYVAPAALGMLVLVLVPFVFGLALGFFNHCEGRFEFVGLRNFWEILSGGGAPLTHPLNFYFTLGVTLLWTVVNVALHTGIGLGLALLLRNPTLRFKGVYRVLLIVPWAVPNYITALMWKGMFHRQFGAVNQVLGLLGISPVSWFSHFWSAFTANVVTNTWLGFPFMMVVSLGALQSIPRELYEAAEVDGASRWATFRHITLPLLKPALLPAVVLGSIWTFNMFNVIYLVSGGEPGGSTDILITEAYRWAFIRYERYGLAAAYAVLIFLILLGYTYLTSRVTRAAKEAGS